jgi:Arc/MetJ family transcription regulator
MCIGRYKMRTNIVLDDNLVKEAFKHSKAKTKKELINQALKEFVENKIRRDLLDLEGKIDFADGYDYKSMREGK